MFLPTPPVCLGQFIISFTKSGSLVKYSHPAEVAELADALRSGRSGIILVRVQIPPSAQDLEI